MFEKARSRRFLWLFAIVALACSAPDVPVELGSKAPRFELPDLDGKTVDSRDFEGRPLVINFWATWCQQCRREFPVLNEMAAKGEADVVAIALDDEGAAVVGPFAEANGLDYPILIGNQEVFQRFKGFAIPYTLVLDAEQTIHGMYRGPASLEDLERDIEKLDAAGVRQES